jgi:hypothetical protein
VVSDEQPDDDRAADDVRVGLREPSRLPRPAEASFCASPRYQDPEIRTIWSYLV